MTCKGPGYATPLDAMQNAPREKLMYVVCIQPNKGKTDLLATVDIDPSSPTYCEVIHKLHTGRLNDEIHHSGWNVCSSCHITEGCSKIPVRDKLILPALGSDRVYVVDTGKDPKAPVIHKVIESSEMHSFNCATPHTTHCSPTGEIMISCLGDKDGNGKCDFILIDAETFKMKGTWTIGKLAKYGYDFWYQPYHDVLISTEWAAPKLFKQGFNPEMHLSDYGMSLNFYSWTKRELMQVINLGADGYAPLEVRFLHNPKSSIGYVGCCVNANIYKFDKKEDGTWYAEKVIDVKPKKVEGWLGNLMQGMITDILISLDDKYLYFSNWLHGDVRQYDISNRSDPKLKGQVFLGGMLTKDSKVKVIEDPESKTPIDPVHIKGKRLHGAPQMLQLSLDGKRLYVSSSLFSPWDKQFYPETIKSGSFMVKIDVDTENGGMKLDENFLVDFGCMPDGPMLAHEMRYPGGDCTSDIWIVNDE